MLRRQKYGNKSGMTNFEEDLFGDVTTKKRGNKITLISSGIIVIHPLIRNYSAIECTYFIS